MHFDPNLTAIAIVFSVALLCGLLLMRFKQPAIIGYIVAGVILGPSGFQIIEETEAAKTLAELGVLLLLFLIGMELSLRAFKTVYKLASVIVLVQVVFSILVTSIIGIAMSWDWQQGILLGFVLAVSSTAVTVKVLADRGELRPHVGRITVCTKSSVHQEFCAPISVLPSLATILVRFGHCSQLPCLQNSHLSCLRNWQCLSSNVPLTMYHLLAMQSGVTLGSG